MRKVNKGIEPFNYAFKTYYFLKFLTYLIKDSQVLVITGLMMQYELCSFSNLSVTSRTSQLILQHFCRFTYITADSPTLPLLHLRHSSFSNPSFASPTSQALHLIHLASYPWNNEQSSFSNLSSIHLCHNSFSNPSSARSPTFHHFTQVTTQSPTIPSLYHVTAHFPTLPSLYLSHSSFSNPSFASPTSQALHLYHLASRP